VCDQESEVQGEMEDKMETKAETKVEDKDVGWRVDMQDEIAEQKSVLAALRRRTDSAEKAAVASWFSRRGIKHRSRKPRPEGEEMANGKVKKVKKTSQQVEALKNLLEQTTDPSTNQLEVVAAATGLSRLKVKQWFAQQRLKARKSQQAEALKEFSDPRRPKKDKEEKVKKCKKKKVLSPQQLEQLRALHRVTAEPSQEQKEEVALQTGLALKEVTLWLMKRARIGKKYFKKTGKQVEALKELLGQTTHPSTTQLGEVAAATGLSVKKVDQWFTNQAYAKRHGKPRKEGLARHQGALLPPEAWELQCQLCAYSPQPRCTGTMERLKLVLAHHARKHLQARVAEVLPRSSLACPSCSYTTNAWCNLRGHWCTAHSTLQTWVRDFPKDGPKDLEQFQCSLCGSKFSHAGNLRKHKVNVHETKAARGQVRCDFCDYTMSYKSDVAMTLRAMLYHQAKFHFAARVAEVLPPSSTSCPECGTVPTTAANLLNHWVGVHTTFRDWVQAELKEKEKGSSSADTGSESDSDDVVIELSDSESEGENVEIKGEDVKTGFEEEKALELALEEEGNDDSDECSIFEEDCEEDTVNCGETGIMKTEIMESTDVEDEVDEEDDGFSDGDVKLVLEEDDKDNAVKEIEEVESVRKDDYQDNVFDGEDDSSDGVDDVSIEVLDCDSEDE